MDWLAETAPLMRPLPALCLSTLRSGSTGSSPATSARIRSRGARRSTEAARRLAKALRHDTLLLIERRSLYLRLLIAAEEPVVPCLRERAGVNLTIGESQARSVWCNRSHSAHQPSVADLLTVEASKPAMLPAEITRIHASDSIHNPGIAVDIRDIHVVDDGRVVETAAVAPAAESPAPPRMERLKRSERHPADIAKSEAEATASTPTEEADQRWRPVAACVSRSGIPAPTRGSIEPAPVVIRGPAPGIVTDPGPAVKVLPDPAALAIRSPARRYRGRPHIAVRRIVHPAPVSVQIFRAIHIAADMLLRPCLRDVPVALLVPLIPTVNWNRLRHLKFRIGRIPSSQHGLALAQALGSTLRSDLGFTGSHRDLRGAVFSDRDPVGSLLGGTDGNARRVDLNLSVTAPKRSKSNSSDCKLYLIVFIFHSRQANFDVRADAKDIRGIKLELGAGRRTGEKTVLHNERRIQRCRDYVARIAPAHGNISVNYADPRYCPARSGIATIGILGHQRSGHRCDQQRDSQPCRFHNIHIRTGRGN